MIRNKMRLRIKGEDFTANVHDFLFQNPRLAESVLNAYRFVILLTLLNHQKPIELTYDSLLFLINRIEMGNQDLRNMEPENIRIMLDEFFS